jgi:uncharacterized protein (DUF2384 family)
MPGHISRRRSGNNLDGAVRVTTTPSSKRLPNKSASAPSFDGRERVTLLAASLTGKRPRPRRSIAYGELYETSLSERMYIARNGISPSVVVALANDLHLDSKALIGHLGINRNAFTHRQRKGTLLSSSDSEHLLGALRLVGQVQRMVERSSNSKGFDSQQWVGSWISSAVPALGNRKPSDFLDTAAGQALISQLLEQIQSGAFV